MYIVAVEGPSNIVECRQIYCLIPCRENEVQVLDENGCPTCDCYDPCQVKDINNNNVEYLQCVNNMNVKTCHSV